MSSHCSTTMPLERGWIFKQPDIARQYYTTLKTFLTSNNHYTDVIVASLVFYPPRSRLIQHPRLDSITDRGLASNAAWNTPSPPARILLLQRKSTDTDFPDLWEVPWGACTLMDSTILHSVKRMILERTGLHIEGLLKEIGRGEHLKNDERLTLRLSFEIEIAEMVIHDFGRYPTLGDIPIKLDPCLHQHSQWVRKPDIINDVFPLAAHQSKDLILQAFRLRRMSEEKVRAQAVRALRTRKRKHSVSHYGSTNIDGAGSVKDADGYESQEDDEV